MKTKSYNKKKMLGLMLAPVFVATIGTAAYSACPGTIPGGSNVTTACTLTLNQSLTVESSGSLIVSGSTAVYVDPGSTGVTIDNSGIISGSNNGVGIDVDVLATGTEITNQAGGVINATGTSFVTGIWYHGDVDATLTNAGVISGVAADSAAATGTGIQSASANASNAYGLYADGDLTSTLNNSGEILARVSTTADANGNDADAYAYGSTATALYLGDITSAGSLINSGEIRAQVDSSATANGVIYATASAYYADYAYALSMGELAGILDNSGNIVARIDSTATATATGNGTTGDAYAYIYDAYSATGIDMEDITATGSFANSGSILADINAAATANGTTSASASIYYASSAEALYMWDLNGTFDNSGTISATIDAVASATAVAGYAYANVEYPEYAYGVDLDDIGYGASFTNSGMINASINASATANGTSNADAYINDAYNAYALQANDVWGSLENSGVINASIDASVEANAPNGSASATINYASDAYAVYIDDIEGPGSFTNSGTINASINADASANGSTYAYVYFNDISEAFGVDMGYLYGTLENTGTISASISASGTATATGDGTNGYADVYVDDVYDVAGLHIDDYIQPGGKLDNSGVISASVDAVAEANGTTQADAYIYYAGSAYGIDMSYVYGDFVNSGSITATADATATAIATGNGTDGSASASVGYVTGAYGIDMYTLEPGASFTNSGTISAALTGTATAEGTDYAYAYATSGYYAYGIEMSDIEGTFDNSGTIMASSTLTATATASGNGTTGYAYASAEDASYVYGIDASWLEDGGTFNNSGVISADASATATASGTTYAGAYASADSAYGMYLSYIDDGSTFTNSGQITASVTSIATATATGEADASAEASYVYGIDMGTVDGDFDNSGIISASAVAIATATADDASATADYAYSVYGIDMSSLDSGRSFTNSGTISASAEGVATANGVTNAYASVWDASYVHGVDMGTIYGTFDNSGEISASINAEATATATGDGTNGFASAYIGYAEYAYGLDASSVDTGRSLINSGTISASINAAATANGTTGADASVDTAYSAYGITMGTLNGTLDNSGSITASIDAVATATATSGYASAEVDDASYAYGIDMSSIGSQGFFINTGDISATINAQAMADGVTYAYARADATSAYGVDAGSINGSGILDNSGTISASIDAMGSATASAGNADASAYATDAYGVYVSTLNTDALLTNSGSISASANAMATATAATTAHASAIADAVSGIYVSTLNGTMDNSGTITATADAMATASGTSATGYAYASAIGVELWTAGTAGVLDNSGMISASANAAGVTSDSAYAAGVYSAWGFNGTLINSGTISGTSSLVAEGYSVDLSTGTGTVNNMTGGLLSGNLYTGGTITVNNDGTVAVPAGADAMVMGTYNQSADGVLSLGILSEAVGEYGTMTIGTANFADDTVLNINLEETVNLTGGEFVDNVVVADALPTAFTVTDNSALFSFEAVYDGTNVDLNVDRQSLVTLVRAYQSSGVAGLAALLDEGFASGDAGDMQFLLSALSRISTEQGVAAAVNSLVPLINGDLPRATIASVHDAVGIVGIRQSGGAGLSSGDEMNGGRNVWGKIYGTTAEQDPDGNSMGYDADNFGILVGFDKDLSASYNIGAALGYGQTDVDGQGGSNADIDSFLAMLYGTYAIDQSTDLNWKAAYGMHDTDTTRHINFDLIDEVAKGSYDSWSAHLGVNVERDYIVNEKTVFTPSARIDYTYVDDDGYTETGAGPLNLRVAGNDVDELILGVDGELAYSIADNKVLSANLGLGFDALADQGSIQASMAGIPSEAFSTKGTDPSEVIYIGGLGFTYGDADDLQFDLRYDVEGREDFMNQAVSLKINKAF